MALKQNSILSIKNSITRYLTERNKIILFIFGIILSISVNILFISSFINSTSALSYQSTADVSFTINPTISVSVSGDLVIDNLALGNYSDSNEITVSVATNSVYGYILSASVGDNSHSNPSFNTTDLTHTNNTNKFTSLSTSDSYSSMGDDNIAPNTWGYSYSNDSGTTWSNYSGLPLYDTTGTTINSKNNPTEDTTTFKIAAKAGPSQVAGDYTNIINFTAVTNDVTHYYMQDFTNSQCQTLASNDDYLVYDKRDESDYTVRWINGQCWMTRNLRITGIISAEDSNFEGEDFNVSEGDLDENITQDNYTYSSPRYHKSNDSVIGAWYNFCAASAGTNCQYETKYDITNDICPTNWKIPNESEISNLYDHKNIFTIVYGGQYYRGSIINYDKGYYWTSTANTNYVQNYLDNYVFQITFYWAKPIGNYIRCVRSS